MADFINKKGRQGFIRFPFLCRAIQFFNLRQKKCFHGSAPSSRCSSFFRIVSNDPYGNSWRSFSCLSMPHYAHTPSRADGGWTFVCGFFATFHSPEKPIDTVADEVKTEAKEGLRGKRRERKLPRRFRIYPSREGHSPIAYVLPWI